MAVLADPDTTGSNIILELDGLKDAVEAATDGVIDRTVIVRNRDLDGFYQGTYPLILIAPADWHLDRLFGGVTGQKGQQPKSPSWYALQIRDKLDARQKQGERVAASQTDLYALHGAIVAHFDHAPNRCLPDGEGNKRAIIAGEHLRWRFFGPYKEEQGGGVYIEIVGTLSCVGLPRKGLEE